MALPMFLVTYTCGWIRLAVCSNEPAPSSLRVCKGTDYMYVPVYLYNNFKLLGRVWVSPTLARLHCSYVCVCVLVCLLAAIYTTLHAICDTYLRWQLSYYALSSLGYNCQTVTILLCAMTNNQLCAMTNNQLCAACSGSPHDDKSSD